MPSLIITFFALFFKVDIYGKKIFLYTQMYNYADDKYEIIICFGR